MASSEGRPPILIMVRHQASQASSCSASDIASLRFVQNHRMDRGTSIADLATEGELVDYYRDDANRWACHRCTKPTLIIAYTPPRPLVPSVFKCPHNQSRAVRGLGACQHFEQVPGIKEPWQ